MITVRFATGFSIQYNSADYVVHNVHENVLYTDAAKTMCIAIVPKDCVVELVTPCRLYHAGDSEIKQSLENAAKSVRSLTRKINKVGK